MDVAVSGWEAARMFAAGGVAGVCARTASAPLDRIKLLFQVQAVGGAGSGLGKGSYTGIWQAVSKIYAEEGLLAFWRGNATNAVRVFPYSAAQMMSNDYYKRMLAAASSSGADARDSRAGTPPPDSTPRNPLSVPQRLVAGALAGMTATALTHPLDTLRLRMALPGSPKLGVVSSAAGIMAAESSLALYRGLVPALIGIAPFAALQFASHDILRQLAYGPAGPAPGNRSLPLDLSIGAAAGSVAGTVCYPLDTIRRRMQMKDCSYSGQADAFVTIWRQEGLRGFFRGWVANTLKVVPQTAIRFVAYEKLKLLFRVRKRKTDT
ncbi:unnamed protein product [Pedinophyceae sp. YPF-701]|nr:unnamed protein product [Pedinophyceae sp. YPF-701]